MKTKTLLLTIFVLVLLTGCGKSDEPKFVQPPPDIKAFEACRNEGGVWVSKYEECENLSKDWCNRQRGTFLECESACRHDPDAEVCTMQCVPVCKFNY